MISLNPFSEIGIFIPPFVMQIYVVAMFLLVIGATIFDVIHKKSAKYFFNNSIKAKNLQQEMLARVKKLPWLLRQQLMKC